MRHYSLYWLGHHTLKIFGDQSLGEIFSIKFRFPLYCIEDVSSWSMESWECRRINQWKPESIQSVESTLDVRSIHIGKQQINLEALQRVAVSAQRWNEPTITMNIPTITVSAYKESNTMKESEADDIQSSSWARCWRLGIIMGLGYVSSNRHVTSSSIASTSSCAGTSSGCLQCCLLRLTDPFCQRPCLPRPL